MPGKQVKHAQRATVGKSTRATLSEWPQGRTDVAPISSSGSSPWQ